LISQTLQTERLAPIDRLRDSGSEFGHVAEMIREFFVQRQNLIAEVFERKNAQEALRQSGEQLRQAQKMEAVGRLAGGVAHDFNNLLTAILGYAELLVGRRDLDDTSRQNVEAIQKAGKQAAAVTHQLLAFSRKQVLQPRVIDLNALVCDFERILRRVIGEHIDLRTHAEAPSGRVRADPNQIEQVILNLGVNARDAMPRGGRLSIRTDNVHLDGAAARQLAPELAGGDYVLLEVTDTGCGMDEEVKSRIFEPFYTTKGPGKGTGLGLATVYGVVKQSGGTTLVESAPGEGTTFRVYLPVADGEVEEARPKTTVPLQPPPRRAEAVLIVEDEEIVRELVCQVLSEHGYNVMCASNGAEAMRMSADHRGPIALLITDVVMPQMGGLELSRRLTAARPELKVLYVSGYSEDDMNEQGVLSPDVEFLEKPFTPQAITRKVREILAGSRALAGVGLRVAAANGGRDGVPAGRGGRRE
ncbi:MAG: response regulator, partial [Gluconacetobacter diazotrophicus]|nr:response regulator [Gluconacetobacter diazotrophicus]